MHLMKPFVCAAVFVSVNALCASAADSNLKGFLVDRMCADAAKTPAKIKELCDTHTKECALDKDCAKSGYTVYSGSKWYVFDDKGNQLARKLIESSKRDAGGMPVEVAGKVSGNTIAVDSLKETKKP